MQLPSRKLPFSSQKTLTFLPLGGVEDVTKNMYLYIYGDEILIVDCGLGFADETMLGVDLLIPDISYLKSQIAPNGRKKIVGMLFTHGHEDHIGALPFILPQLSQNGRSFQAPMYASPLTAALANEKLKEFRTNARVNTVQFTSPQVNLGSFSATFIRVTHSVPDSSNIFIKTPAGNFFHTGDYKMDLTPYDGKKTDYHRITKLSSEGVLALMSDSLGAERPGFTSSEAPLVQNFETAMRDVKGKVIITTYSSNIARINQAIEAAAKFGRKVCFVGRSVIKATQVAKTLGYMRLPREMEVDIRNVKNTDANKLLLVVAGSQGQENSALSRIAGDEHRDVELKRDDMVIFSADAIPGNEVLVRALIDDIAKKGATVLYSDTSDEFHVSGHGSQGDLTLMMSLVNASYVVPISAAYSSMLSYKKLAKNLGYRDDQVVFPENGQEIIFSKGSVKRGAKHEIRNVYVDEISGEEVEGFVLRDRERLAKEGVIIVMAEVSSDGKLTQTPDIIVRGFSPKEVESLRSSLAQMVSQELRQGKHRSKPSAHMRRQLEEKIERYMFKTMQRKPLVLPIVIEV